MKQLLEQAQTLQNLLVSEATGGSESDADYRQLRQVFLFNPALERLLPPFVRTCRTLPQFWQFIKHKVPSYAERRGYIWDEFSPLLDRLENGGQAADETVSTTLEGFDTAHVNAVWSKALDRRETDPEGAITSARTLLETVCKHVLDDLCVEYGETDDLPKLYGRTAKALNLSPSQHTEEVFKQILGGCTTVVQGLGSLRNRLSDAHGKGRVRVSPSPRHAELAVNLAGAMASFLIQTLNARKEVEA